MGSRLALLTLVLALAACLPAPAGAAESNDIVAHLSAPTHMPKAGEHWPIMITAHDREGHRIHARVRYAYLYKGDVVARFDPKSDAHFVGVFHDPHLAWSKRTIGLELTFRAIVDSSHGQANLDYDVKVTR
jgi:hypothetical protein